MEEILHGDKTGEVAEKGDRIVGTIFPGGISERTHFFCIGNEAIKSFNPAAGGGAGG